MATTDEKDRIASLSASASDAASSAFSHDEAREKAIVRKIDWAVMPIMTLYYLLSFLDRGNIGNARVAGMQEDLRMTDHQYQVCVTILFVPYILAELPANLLLRKVGPRILMPSILTIWGVIVALQGIVTSYPGLVVIRAFLGLVEGPMFPGIVLFLSGFYTRADLALRIAIFFSSASLSGAFSGLLAAAIVNMHGVGGKPGWAWIFILEGSFSALVGLIGFFVTPSTPREVIGLTEEEKDIYVSRLERDRPTLLPNDKFTFREVAQSLTSPHVIITFIVFYMTGTTLYGLGLFLPSIVKQLGFSSTKTQLLSVGPFGAGFIVTLLAAYLSDKYKSRAIPTAVVAMIALIGYAVFLRATSKYMAYGSLFLCVSGVYATPPMLSAWMANNSEPYYRRATSIAFGFIATNAGGITSTWLFPTVEGPRFTKTTILNIVMCAVLVVGPLLNAVYLSWRNKQKQRNREVLLAPYRDLPDGEARAIVELGDKHPDFVYCY